MCPGGIYASGVGNSSILALSVWALAPQIKEQLPPDIPDGVPATVETRGIDPSEGMLAALLANKLAMSGSKDITLNVDGGDGLRLILRLNGGQRLSVTYLWRGEKFRERRYTCVLGDLPQIRACSDRLFDESVRAARFLKRSRRQS